MSRPPTDGWPRKRLAFNGAGAEDCLNLQGLLLAFMTVKEGTELLDKKQTRRVRQRENRDLTFDMSGGAKGAKRPLGRPLDGGVRRLQVSAVPLCASAVHSSDSSHAVRSSTGDGIRPLSHSAHMAGVNACADDSMTQERKSFGPPLR